MSHSSILFLGSVVPETKEFCNKAFNRSGNAAQDGIICGLSKHCEVEIVSNAMNPAFPHSNKLFIAGRKITYKSKIKLLLVPYVNILIIRELCIGIMSTLALVRWAIRNRAADRHLLMYNPYSPPLPFVYIVSKLLNIPLHIILYDIGIPPQELNLGKMRMAIYHIVESVSKFCIPKIKGRIVINDAIARDYAPNKDYLLVDGGLSDEVLASLFELSPKPENRGKTIFLCAGSMWFANGTQFILNAMKFNNNPNIEIWFAGKGQDVDLIKRAEFVDCRIKYKGFLDIQHLFELYKNADVLLNLRIISGEESNYVFPSKLLEYLVVGKYTVSTSIAHIARDYGHICHVIPDQQPADFAMTLDKIALLSSDALYNKGKKARDFMLENRTWNQQSTRIYQYVVNNTVL